MHKTAGEAIDSGGRVQDGCYVLSMLKASASHFAQVPIDQVLASVSSYGFDVSADLRPDVLKRDLGSILKVEEKNSKKHIKLDEEALKEVGIVCYLFVLT